MISDFSFSLFNFCSFPPGGGGAVSGQEANLDEKLDCCCLSGLPTSSTFLAVDSLNARQQNLGIAFQHCMRVGLKVSVGQPDMHLVLEFGQISGAAFNGRLSSRYSCCNWSALTPSFGTKTWKWLTSFHILLQNQLHRVPCHSMTEGRPTEKNVSICALPKSDTFF